MASNSKTTGKAKRQPGHLITEAILKSIEPFIAIATDDPLRLNDEQTDTGHEKLKDKTFAFLMSNCAQQIHRQLYGNLRGSDGRSFDNAKTWYENSKVRLAKVEADLHDPRLSDAENRSQFWNYTDFIKGNWYVATNAAKCEALEDLLSAFCDVYYQLTGESWAPREEAAPAPMVARKQIDPELKARLEASYNARMGTDHVKTVASRG